jgi:S-adenosylmethionine:tRNA ribosyltransferase-isomerase
MHVSEFDYQLPEELIANYPLQQRSQSRLLCVDKQSGDCDDKHFADIVDYLAPGDLLVLNDSRVIPARIYGHKATGGKVEILVERILDGPLVLAHLKASKAPKPGTEIILSDEHIVEVTGREGDLFLLQFADGESPLSIIEALGEMPLPPYIRRSTEDEDKERYQTVYSRHKGSVAAPTAGLHFDEALLSKLQAKGVEIAYVTLHVGAGTFQPVRCENILEHKMHYERLTLNEKVVQQIKSTKQQGRRVIAVGTTSVRCLETAAKSGDISTFEGESNLFIYPGYQFKCIDGLITNFHLPKSTLLMLVCAFAGQENILSAYHHAVEQQYRFFSYGDAMFIS